MEDLYTGTVRFWWQKLEKTQINGKLSDDHGLKDLILLKYPYYLGWSIN